jgi:cobalt/nickel transport system permease protein
MHASLFDRYRSGDSAIHRLDPRIKVVATVLFVLSNVLLPDGAWLAFILALGLVLLVTRRAGLPWSYAVKRSFVALPFALAAVSVLFTVPGVPVATLHVGPWTLTITDAAVIRFASILLRSLISVQMVILLLATTPFPDLLHALAHLHVPGLLVNTMAFAYRYLHVLSDEVLRLLRARDARSARLPGLRGGGSVLWRARVAGNMVGQLFLRSLERADRVYQAMLARGFSGHILTTRPHALRAADWWALCAFTAALAFVQGAAWLAR